MMRDLVLGGLVLGVCASTMGCAGAGLVQARAAEDMGCPAKQIEVTSREMGAYDARGCGKKLSYVLRGGEVFTDDGSDLGDMHHGD